MQAKHIRTGLSPLHQLSTRSLAALALSLTAVAEVEDELDTLVVSAIRTPLDIGKNTAAVSTLDTVDLERRGIVSLRDALNEVPGVISTSTGGQAGALGSLFIRGTTTAYSQIVVDGIRLSDATVQLGNFLGGAGIDDLGRIEVLRGPQAAFYGGEAVGGVVWLETARGSGSPAGRLTLEAGSHDSFRASASHRGSQGNLAWFVGASREFTDNDARFNHFDQTRGALRTEWSAGDWTTGVTFRAIDSRYENPYTFAPSIDRVDATLATAVSTARNTTAIRPSETSAPTSIDTPSPPITRSNSASAIACSPAPPTNTPTISTRSAPTSRANATAPTPDSNGRRSTT